MDLIMPEVTFMPTYDCTLNCKLCGNNVPYMHSEKRAFSLEEILQSIDRYFQIVSHVKMVTICGGEPLLFPQLAEVICCLKKYADQADRLRLVTNGTLIPNRNVLDAMKALGKKFYILADNYGPQYSKKIKELDEVLTEISICHTIRNYTKDDPYMGGWVDFGDFTEKKHTEAEAAQLHAACASTQCYPVSYGKIWPCAVPQRRSLLGLGEDVSEYIDLLDDSLSLQEQQEKLWNISQKKCLTGCAYCNGLCPDSERFIPAEQLTPEECQYVRSGARSYGEVRKMMKRQSVHQTD